MQLLSKKDDKKQKLADALKQNLKKRYHMAFLHLDMMQESQANLKYLLM